MPSISAHMIVANEVGKILNNTSDDFIRGNLLPDIIDKEDSHLKYQGPIYLVPDIEANLKVLDLSKDLDKGILVHLLLDKYYLEEYVTNKYPDRNIFLDKVVYSDYDYLNYDLLKLFNIDIDIITKILNNYNCKINEEKLKYNIECLNQKTVGNPTYLDLDSFSKFLKDISIVIAKEVDSYENQSS